MKKEPLIHGGILEMKNGNNISIGIVSISSIGETKYPIQYNQAIVQIRKKFGNNITEYKASHDEIKNRARLFMKAIVKNNVVITTIGGMTAVEILPYLDFNKISTLKTILLGYSDISIVLNAIVSISKKKTFLGPMVIPSFGEHPEPCYETLTSLTKSIENKTQKLLPFKYEICETIDWDSKEWGTRARNKSAPRAQLWNNLDYKVIGRIIGGNADSLISILNTEYLRVEAGDILFFEDNNISEGNWRRNMMTYYLSGMFNKIGALVFGKTNTSLSFSQMDNFLKEIGVNTPRVFGIDFGHTDPFYTIPIGGEAKIDFLKKTIEVV